MDLKAMSFCYNSIDKFMCLVSIFNIYFSRQYSSPNYHSENRHFGKHRRARVKLNRERCECFRRAY
jgi:hypothetical protein